MAFTENLSDFINPDTPGFVVAVINGAPVDALFDNEFSAAQAGLVGFEDSQPALTCKTADINGLQHGVNVVVGAVTYKAAGIQPDGLGVTYLLLKK